MKRFLLLGLVLALSVSTYASHLMGGEIVVKHDTADQHTIYLRLYRDDYGIPFANGYQVGVLDTSSQTMNYIQMTLDTSGFLPTSAYPIEFAVYTGTVSLQNGFYYFGWDNCCRNAAIQNATAPGSASMQLHASLLVDGMGNSTPDFGIQPALIVPVDTVWTHNSLPFDVNGDSIAWRLDTPLDLDTSSNGSGQVYVAGYTHPPSDSTGVFSINSATGTITWDPAALGNYIASVLVEEYRNGVRIGAIRRDYQFVVISDSSNLRIDNINQVPVNTDGDYEFSANAMDNINFTLRASNSTGNADIEVYGEPLNFNNNPATVNIIDNGSNVSAEFDWTPNHSQARNRAYPVVYRVSDDVFNFDFTILYRVNEVNTSIGESPEMEINLYPNPAIESFNVKLEEVIKYVQIYDMNGKLVSSHNGNGQESMNIVAPSTSGIYLVHIASPSGLQTLKLSIK